MNPKCACGYLLKEVGFERDDEKNPIDLWICSNKECPKHGTPQKLEPKVEVE